MPTIRVIAGPHSGQSFALAEGSAEIGRDSGCGIPLVGDGGVSRRHARLEVRSGVLIVHDSASSNGVYLNGARTASTIIQPGDKLQLGNTVMVLESEPTATVDTVSHTPGAGAAAPYPSPAAPYPSPAAPYTSSVGPQPAPPPAMASGAPPGYPAGPPGYPAGYPAPVGPYPGYGASDPSDAVPSYANWLYFLGFSIPPIGVILALIYLLKDTPGEQRLGKWLMGWSIFGGLLTWLGIVEMLRLWHAFAPQINGSLGGTLGGDPTADPTAVLRQHMPSSYTNNLPGLPTR